MLLSEPIVGFFSLYTGFNFSVVFAFMAAYPFIFRSTVLLCDHYFYQPRVRESKISGKGGIVAPEYRLYPAMAACFGVPMALFWFGWTAQPTISWWSPA